MEGLKVGPIAVADGPREKARADPGVNLEVLLVFHREYRRVKGGDPLVIEIDKDPR